MKLSQKSLFIIIISIISLTSCAYFNTFYNAKRYFKLGQEETKKNRTGQITSTERSNYQRASEKAKRLIQEYQNSKYVDDALLMLGKCYYYTEENAKAQRQLDILIKRFPDSPLIPEAKLWYAKSLLAQEKYQDAAIEFMKLIESEIPNFVKGETSYYLGNLYSEQTEYAKAIAAYEIALKYGSEDLRAEAMYSIGANHDSLRQYSEAAESFRKVLDMDPSPELRYDSQFRYGQMLNLSGEHDKARKLFERLLGDERNKAEAPYLRLEIADCLRRKGVIDDAITAYDDIIIDFKGTVHASKASFMIGQIYENVFNDFERALESYRATKSVGANCAYRDSSEMYARDIQRYLALKDVVIMGLKGQTGALEVTEATEIDTVEYIDSLMTVMIEIPRDSMKQKFKFMRDIGGRSFADSILKEPDRLLEEERKREQGLQFEEEVETLVAWYDWYDRHEIPGDEALEQELLRLFIRKKRIEALERAENPELKVLKIEEVDKNLFFLAELYLFRLDQPDSALSQYRTLVEKYPESPYAPQAMFNQAYIYETFHQDSLKALDLRLELKERYPNSEYAFAALRQTGNVQMALDSSTVWLTRAEKLLFDENSTDQALTWYRHVWENSMQSRARAKALYAMGWIYENKRDSLDLAYVLYDSLVNNFPETRFAVSVKPKVTAFELAQQTSGDSLAASLALASAQEDSLTSDETESQTDESAEIVMRPLLSAERLQSYAHIIRMRRKKSAEAMP